MFPSDRFAAFLAHSLNSSDTPVTTVEPGRVYVALVDALAEKYKESLLYHSTYRYRMGEEEAAAAYFKITLERALWLSNKVEMSVAHRLLVALCQRGVGAAWQNAELRRDREEEPQQGDGAVTPLLAVGSFEALAARLGKLSFQISPGNAAGTIRERKGALWLLIGVSRAQVPEEVSAWNAIVCGPTLVKSLPAGEPFNRFCGIVIDAVRTANRPFQELLSVGRGICPFDWIDVLSTNQVRGLRRFLDAAARFGEPDSLDLWSRAWAEAPVPGFRSAAELWTSDIGAALRLPSGNAPPLPIDGIESHESGADHDDDGPNVLTAREFQRRLASLQDSGVICAVEQAVLERLYGGASFSDLVVAPDVKKVLQERGMKFPQFIAALQRRVESSHPSEGADRE